MEQKKLNVPSVSVGIVTVTTSPAATVRLIPSSGMAKPWVPATPVSRISRTSPFFAVTAEGENAQLSADISIVRFAEGEEVELAESLELSDDSPAPLSEDSDVEEEVTTDDIEEEEASSESPPVGISHAARTRTREKYPVERRFLIGMERGK